MSTAIPPSEEDFEVALETVLAALGPGFRQVKSKRHQGEQDDRSAEPEASHEAGTPRVQFYSAHPIHSPGFTPQIDSPHDDMLLTTVQALLCRILLASFVWASCSGLASIITISAPGGSH